MIDTDVMRLRQLRGAALRARALARALNSASKSALFARSAVVFWSIARIATGQLRAHPFLAYQKGPNPLRELTDRAICSVAALAAGRRRRSFSTLAMELQRVGREVDDARALARLPDLSDALGRTQLQLRRLAAELDLRVRGELGTSATPGSMAGTRAESGAGAVNAMADQDNWPYLAI
jgi:hypothetical protein